MKVISVENLNFEYEEGQNTLNNVSFDIEEGEYVAILGHNGSGKSTIAKLLMGLLEAKSGKISVHNMVLCEETVYDVRDHIGIVFQNPDNQFIGSTVRDDIAFGLENKCVDPKKMDEIIELYASKVNMMKFLDHEPEKLSGGQKQRVAIAGILAMHPDILILDESTSMLDPRGKSEINALVSEICETSKMTVISITHDIEEAAKADRIILLNHGSVVKTGTPKEILSDVELIESLGLDVPFAYRVSYLLKQKGYQVTPTIEKGELVNELCQLHVKN